MASSPPTKSQRKFCWEARDNYFKCIDANKCVSIEDDKSENCAQLKKVFMEKCPASWVSLNC
ncbi:Cytochrome c oxidase assembly factor 6 [Entomophthora muscae]|uniref:Cytochrome c oxidase assembly factor 6 n=1 Tax=Entomophthora muscae TaxID=34485 RepID=A0ACC2UN90_9FUNG|nr:Cytochrome c oxidase assembly factor 6 [Entomophthora muscae]